jgi:hypothetical protein
MGVGVRVEFFTGTLALCPGHSFAATYRITTPVGTSSVTVDQRRDGGQWRLLKTLTLAANDNWQVELSDQSPGEVVADAIAVTPPISLADKFEWAPTLPAAGDYAVYAKWQAEASRASDATYEITHDGGVAQVSVDQTHNGGEWRYLGTWSFDPLNAPKVTLLGALTGTLSADAIRFVSGDSIGGAIAYTWRRGLKPRQRTIDGSAEKAASRLIRSCFANVNDWHKVRWLCLPRQRPTGILYEHKILGGFRSPQPDTIPTPQPFAAAFCFRARAIEMPRPRAAARRSRPLSAALIRRRRCRPARAGRQSRSDRGRRRPGGS